MGYMLTQVFTGHGVFGKYLQRIGIEESDGCWFCKMTGGAGTPEHTLWGCPEWEAERTEARRSGLNLDRETIGSGLMESERKWKVFKRMLNRIMWKKTGREGTRRRRVEV
ncbi:uncharacterized protein [Euwallacea fornicatus]|uniref:uncharacterized protein n=1 Tax=Euwallacea fornicatus TaxID=995702 RepID=UPI00338F0C13